MDLTNNNYNKKNLLRLGPLYVLYAVVLSYNFLSGPISSVIFVCMALAPLVFGNIILSKSYLKIVWPLIFVFAIGIAGVGGYEGRDIARDVVYGLSPIALICLGYWLGGKNIGLKDFIKAIVFIGILSALIHLFRFALNPELIGADLVTVTTVSYVSGDFVVLALVLGLFQNRLGLGNLFPRFFPRYLSIIFLFLSFVLSYSRTGLVVFCVLSLALMGYLHRIRLRSVLVGATLVIMFFIMATMEVDDRSMTFAAKLIRSLTEVKISDYQNYEDINYNWRGFETFKVVQAYMSGSGLQKIFGQGFGSLVPLGFTMNLMGTDYDYIPVVHNGYGYVLLKTGLIGLLLYLAFYLNIIYIAVRNSKSNNTIKKHLGLLLLGVVLCLMITMYVVGGLAQAHSAEFVLLVGYLIRRLINERYVVA